MSSTNNTRNLYSKSALVRIMGSKPSEDRIQLIHITVDYHRPTIAAHKNELIIKLTDENDPFFLYSLYLNEDDYQSFKMSQGLLVDFSSFGEELIGLLKGCEKEEKAEKPKFQLCFKSKDPLTAMLEVVENNPFKLLCHVSLTFSMGNDSDVKAYLADCLNKLKDQHIKLSTIYEQTKNDLTAKLDNAHKTLAAKMTEIDRLKSESETNVQRLASKYGEELEFERERARQAEFASQQRYEKERKEAEANMLKTIKNMEMRVQELEHQNSELSEKRFKNEQALQDKGYQINTLQADLANARSELAQFKKENTTLDMKVHSSEKQINQLDLQIGQLQRDLKDKSDQIAKFQENLLSEQVQRRQLEDMLKEKQIELKKKVTEVAYYIDECKRGHDALKKLQESEKKLINNIKLKSKVLQEQENKMNAKEIETAQLSDECKSVKAQLQSLKDELNSLKSELKKKSSDLDEAMSKLSQKETLINYYNKQLNDREKISSEANKSYDPTSNSPAHSFRPYGNLLSTNNQFINANLSPATNLPSGYPMAKSTSGSALVGTNIFPSTELDITGAQNAMNAGRFGASGVMSTAGGVVGNVQKNPLLSSSSSSMSHHHGDHSKENLELNPIILGERAEKLKIGSASSSSTNGPTTTSGKLDPKYFHNPSLNTAQLGGGVGFDLQKKQQQLSQSQQPMNNNPLPAHLVNPSTKSNNLIQHSGGAPMSLAPKTTSAKSTPPIASNYFPH